MTDAPATAGLGDIDDAVFYSLLVVGVVGGILTRVPPHYRMTVLWAAPIGVAALYAALFNMLARITKALFVV